MAKKDKTVFYCNSCGHEVLKWIGQCPMCHGWNTFVEERVRASNVKGLQSVGETNQRNRPCPINQVTKKTEDRMQIGISELDRVLGGGLVRGSLTLIGGDPGIGKSTLLLQVCRQLSGAGHKVLYISGEESQTQIKLRAERLGTFTDNLQLFCETDLGLISDVIQKEKPEAVVIDSIQTLISDEVSSQAGSVSQVREATAVFLRLSKGLDISIFIVGHVTKEGTVAGPRVLEHMVDTVLYFEGDRHASYRILRGVKNRFGSTDEIGVFEMQEKGLIEVQNPSEFMLAGRPENESGAVVTCCVEGSRCIMLELQSLVTRTNFGFPRRQASGTDFNRLNLLMAVLEKRLNLAIGDYDAYINIAGGMKVNEPALDLAMVMAVVSGFKNRVIDADTVVFGEVGLSGEVRSVSMAESRLREAVKLGFKKCIMPLSNMKNLKIPKGISVTGVKNVREAIEVI